MIQSGWESPLPLMALLQNQPDRAAWQTLTTHCLSDPQRAKAFSITAQTVQPHLELRLALFRKVYSKFQILCQSRHLPLASTLPVLWDLWLPLAMQLAELRHGQDQALILGILGGQGTGKTTLGAILRLILQHLGYRTLSLSLDDLYKTYADRQLLQQQDPRLLWRGPPGTHDVELGIQVLEQLRQATAEQTIWVPRFDKCLHQGAGDRTPPEPVSQIDIVLFEGWFVGVRPIDPGVFDTAPAPIVTERDRAFARDMNTQLQAYLPLWQQLDRLIILYPVDYRLSKQWRKQAEQEMRAAGQAGMDDAQVEAFVEYFWQALHPQLFIQPLLTHPKWTDLVIEINADHLPGKVYSVKQQPLRADQQ